MSDLKNIRQLDQWLIAKGIDTAIWGTGAAKPVEDLWTEIVNGESRIEDDPPLRVVHVVNVIIRDGNRVLMEGVQEFDENRRRYRGAPLSEKMKPGEDYIGATLRGIEEELQVGPANVEITRSSPEPQFMLRESPSYPGLHTKYVVYTVEVKIENLPDHDFWTYEAQSNKSDRVKRHQWQWEVIEP